MTYFRDFGLSPKEEKIYLACLALGSSPASLIAERVGIKRPATYLILDNLVKGGFLSTSSRNGVQQYCAIDPDTLAEMFLQKHRQMSHKIEFFKENIPELRAIESKRAHQPKIRLFTGKEAIKKLYETLIDTPSWSCFFDVSVLETSDPDGEFLELFWKITDAIIRDKKTSRDIFTDCAITRKYQKKVASSGYEMRISPTKTGCDSFLFDDHFFLISYEDTMQLLEVQNTPMAQLQLALFEGLWQSLGTE